MRPGLKGKTKGINSLTATAGRELRAQRTGDMKINFTESKRESRQP